MPAACLTVADSVRLLFHMYTYEYTGFSVKLKTAAVKDPTESSYTVVIYCTTVPSEREVLTTRGK